MGSYDSNCFSSSFSFLLTILLRRWLFVSAVDEPPVALASVDKRVESVSGCDEVNSIFNFDFQAVTSTADDDVYMQTRGVCKQQQQRCGLFSFFFFLFGKAILGRRSCF